MCLIEKAAAAFRQTQALFRQQLAPRASGRGTVLFLMQLALTVLQTAILLFVVIIDEGARRTSYVCLLIFLIILVLFAMRMNLKGRYTASMWITMAMMSVAPWLALLVDPQVLAGDIIPLIYIVLSIHLCATFLSELATASIALLQLAAVAVLLILNPNYHTVNWPSFCSYIVSASVIGITISYITRRHMRQIEEQNRALRQSEEQLRLLSIRDPLTGQYNRRYMEETLEREINRVTRKDLPLGLMITDLNDFKEINDREGHLAGDAALCHIALILSDFTRKSDVVCRFGGDEFVMIFPECTKEVVEARRDEISRRLSESQCECGGKNLGCITMSFGIASLPEDGVTAAELLRVADEALYAAKRKKQPRQATCPEKA